MNGKGSPEKKDKDDKDKDKSGKSPTKKGDKKNKKKMTAAEMKAAEEEEEKAKEVVKTDEDIQYENTVLERFLLEFVMTYGKWYNAPWEEAKVIAMKKEALSYCAATRIAAMARGKIWKTNYARYLYNHILLQSGIRRKLSANKTKMLMARIVEDWVYRQRYGAGTLLQAVVRRFIKRCWYYRVMEKVKQQEVLVQKARRFRLRKIRQAEKKFLLFKQAVRFNGIMCFVSVKRADRRSYSRDNSVVIEVYTPNDQKLYKFHLDEAELRHYLQVELKLEVLSVGDITDTRNLKRLISARIIVYRAKTAMDSQNVVFSKHALGQRGMKQLTKGKRISGHAFVCKVFETGDDLTIQCYHRQTCRVFNCNIARTEMYAWVTEEFQLHEFDELEKMKEPAVLKMENRKMLYDWLLQELVVDTRKGVFKVLFKCHLVKSRKMTSIIRIQALWRRALNRPFVLIVLDRLMLKVRASSEEDWCYYVNRKTGASSWDKPAVLGLYDLPTQPSRRWERLTYQDMDGQTVTHYVNPWTGKYTQLTVDQAIRKVQALARKYLLSPLKMPLADFVKAGKLYNQAEQYYDQGKVGGVSKKLASVINHALCTHLIDLDEERAKELYGEAVELSEANPLVTRAFAFYLLGTCEAPIKLNRERAHTLLGDAKRKDEEHVKFDIAYKLFSFSCIRRPTDYRALLNLALVQTLMYDLNYRAEKMLRRALILAPFEPRVMEVWNYLKDRFPERQALYHPKSRINNMTKNADGTTSRPKRVIHGRPCAECKDWAGWVYVEDDEFGTSKKFPRHAAYWYNPVDTQEQASPPDFDEAWVIRKNRSQFTEDEKGLETYWDALTSDYFQFHPLTNSYS